MESGSERKLSSLNQLPNLTSSFYAIHRRSLNIIYENASDTQNLFDSITDYKFNNNLLLSNLNRNDLRIIDERLDILEKLNQEEKSFALCVNKVILHDPLKISIRESFTNNFVDFLLNKIEFNQYPLILNAQPKYSFEVEGSKVTGRPEFSVEKEDQIRVLFLDESRHLSNFKLATEFSECQMAAEMLCCAYTNYAFPLSASLLKDQTVFAVRIIGTRFTFYKAFIKKTYMDAVGDGILKDSDSFSILRYPSNDDRETLYGFDFSNESHRPTIIKLLVFLREQVKKM